MAGMGFVSAALTSYKNNRRWMRKTVAFDGWDTPTYKQEKGNNTFSNPENTPAFKKRMKLARRKGLVREVKMYICSMVIVAVLIAFFMFI